MTIHVTFNNKALEISNMGFATTPMNRMYEDVDRYEIRDGLLILTKLGEKSGAIIPMDNVLYISIEGNNGKE